MDKKELLKEIDRIDINPDILPLDFFTCEKIGSENEKNSNKHEVDMRQYEPMHIALYGYSGRKIKSSYKPISKMLVKYGIINR